jgi:DNA-binding XRE family transcriptional regulator
LTSPRQASRTPVVSSALFELSKRFGLGLMGLSLATTAGASGASNLVLVGHEQYTNSGVSEVDFGVLDAIAATNPIIAQYVRFLAPAKAAAPPADVNSDLVQRVYRESGLTWEQLAHVFGVSRRALHMWATGGRLNAKHQELLVEFAHIVSTLPGDTSDENRAALLQPQADGRSIIDRMRARHSAKNTDINRELLTPEEVLNPGSGRRDI